jgi:hypothetical protein
MLAKSAESNYRSTMTNHIGPILGRYPLNAITAR